MRNDELGKAEAVRYAQVAVIEALYKNSPAGLAQVDGDLRFVRVNERLAVINGLPAAQHIGRCLCEVLPELGPKLEPLCRKVIDTGEPAVDQEVCGATPGRPGEPRNWIVNFVPMITPEGEVGSVMATILDITDLARARESLSESERFARSTLDALSANLCVVDERGSILFVNEAWNRFARENGAAPQSAGVGSNYLEVCRRVAGPGGDEAMAFADMLEAVLQGTRREFKSEYSCHTPDRQCWFTVRVSRFPGEGPVRAVILHTDITHRKQTEQSLQASKSQLGLQLAKTAQLSQRLLQAQEEERRRVALELHDEVGQALTAVRLNLSALERRRGARGAIADSMAVVDQAIELVRTLSLDLRPTILDDLGLVPALKWYCERQAERSGLRIVLHAGPIEVERGGVAAITCYRIAQEAVTNALRHAAASRIDVTLAPDDGGFMLRVSDDGKGFDAGASGHAGSGLSGMAERAALAGASFTLGSLPGTGTAIEVRFARGAGEAVR